MAKYKLKVEGVSSVTPNNKGFIDNVDPTEVYYDSETNTIMLGDGTITEAEPDLTPGITPSDGEVLAYNGTSGVWKNTSNLKADKITMSGADGIVIEGDTITSPSGSNGYGLTIQNEYIYGHFEDGTINDDLYIDIYDDAIEINSPSGSLQFQGNTSKVKSPGGNHIGFDSNEKFNLFYNGERFVKFINAVGAYDDITLTLPNSTGTLALTSDIPEPYVPNEIVVTGYTTNASPTIIGDDIVIPNNTIRNFSIKGVGVGNEGLKDTYTGTPNGCSTPVTISFVYPGAHTPTKSIGGNGEKNINTLISEYNTYVALGDPGLIITLTSGDGTQIIADRTNIELTGGTNIYRSASYNIVGTAKNINGTPVVKIGNTGVKPSYTGTPAGCSTPVTITAAYASTGIPSIQGNGVKTINTLIAEYNVINGLEYPISLISGDGSQVISNGTKVELTGGTSVPMIDELSDELNIDGMSAAVHIATDSMNVTATGKSGTIINWSAKVEWHDITFA